jgi:RNA polymerase sigma factor (sigma-70 family)
VGSNDLLEDDHTSTEFLTALKQQNADAWERFFQIHVPIIRQMCRRRIGDTNDADDVVNTTINRLLVYIPRFQRQPDHLFRNYVRATAWSQIQQYFRNRKRELRHQTPKPIFGSQYSHREIVESIRIVRQHRRFGASSWQAFEMFVFDIPCYQTISERLQQKPDTVSKSIRRIVAAVEQELHRTR